MKKLVGIAAALMASSILSGCASMADATQKLSGVGAVTEEKSTFDGATIVTMAPAFLHRDGSWGLPFKLGARWTSASPDLVGLLLSYSSSSSSGNAYTTFSRLDVNIDGVITSYVQEGLTQRSNSGYNTITRTIYG